VWSSRASTASAVVLGGAIAGVAFGAAGGTELTRTSIVEVLLILIGGIVIAAAVLYGRPGPLYGVTSVLLFGALALLTAIAITWSVVPELTYIEVGRTLAYLVVFAAAVSAARVVPQAAPVVLTGLLLGLMAAVCYSLASRVWPGALAENELSNRIGEPFQYWNAVATAAAMCAPICLWLASRRGGPMLARAMAYPALGLAVLAILLTQSRGALAAAGVAAIIWFAFVPLRLRSLPVLVLAAAGGGAVGAWALSKDAFSKSLQPLQVKESVAGEFGLLLVLLVVGLLAAGLAVNVGLARGAPPVRLRRRIGVVAVAIACAVPLAAFTSVAFSDRGIGGTISDRVDQLTSETQTSPQEGAGRIAASSSTRGKYWREAGRVFDDRPAIGTGPGTFRIARLRHRTDAAVTAHAHGFVPQTLADMGLVGLAVSLALLLAWLVAAARTTGLYPRRLRWPWRKANGPLPRRDWDGERIAFVAVALVAIAFGVQSGIDWTWFVPGPAVAALVAAGYVAGRGPVLATPGGAVAMAEPPRPKVPSVPSLVAAGGVVVTAALCAWAIWQPEASDEMSNKAIDLADAQQYDAAVAKARDAADANPLTPKPYFVAAAAETSAGDERAAQHDLESAVLRYPGDPQTWIRLSRFELGTADDPAAAVDVIQGALYLDPRSAEARQVFLEARSRLRVKQGGG
jgi:O-antigen ligase